MAVILSTYGIRFIGASDERMSFSKMAFTGSTALSRLLLVSDTVCGAVHVIDVGRGKHVGYVAVPGSIAEPRGVAARGTNVVVSAYVRSMHGGVLRLYEGSGVVWMLTRVLRIVVTQPYGLRFTDDGKQVVVAAGESVSLLRENDGALVRRFHHASRFSLPVDVQECAEHGWAVADWCSNTITFTYGPSGAVLEIGKRGSGDGEFMHPEAVAFVPDLGLVVREYGNGGRLQFFATPDAVAMAAMSIARTSWMAAAARAV